jgi:tRNA-specific 2-thiouridylase
VKKVVVALSGGVDSAVSAYLLKKKGDQVIALFMKNWEEEGHCPSAIDAEDVAEVCRHLAIPFYAVNFSKEYREQVFANFLSESAKGRTPNPDILCNREIKFNVLYQKAREMGADALATGHYCQIGRSKEGKASLLRGADPTKDQSYFLCAVNHEVLSHVEFPVGGLKKSEVRKIAKEVGISVAGKKDSTGICFIGKRDFKTFLSEHLKAIPGDFVTLEGKVVGRHDGLPYYTIGQRKGLAIGGPGEAWFIVEKDVEKNVIYLVQGENHPALFKQSLTASDPSWIAGQAPSSSPFTCTAKIRYRQPDFACLVTPFSGGSLQVDFEKPQRAVTPGQAIVFYQGEVCLGGATIR